MTLNEEQVSLLPLQTQPPPVPVSGKKSGGPYSSSAVIRSLTSGRLSPDTIRPEDENDDWRQIFTVDVRRGGHD